MWRKRKYRSFFPQNTGSLPNTRKKLYSCTKTHRSERMSETISVAQGTTLLSLPWNFVQVSSSNFNFFYTSRGLLPSNRCIETLASLFILRLCLLHRFLVNFIAVCLLISTLLDEQRAYRKGRKGCSRSTVSTLGVPASATSSDPSLFPSG